MRQVLPFFLFSQWRNWSTEKLSELAKVAQYVSGRTCNTMQIFLYLIFVQPSISVLFLLFFFFFLKHCFSSAGHVNMNFTIIFVSKLSLTRKIKTFTESLIFICYRSLFCVYLYYFILLYCLSLTFYPYSTVNVRGTILHPQWGASPRHKFAELFQIVTPEVTQPESSGLPSRSQVTYSYSFQKKVNE